MIGWSVIASTLQAIFSDIASRRATGEAPFEAKWIDGRKPWADGKRLIIEDERGFTVGLTITSVSAIGEDDRSETFDTDTAQLLETASGQRKFTLQVQSLSVANSVNSDWATAITERTRTRLNSRRVLDQLLAIDVSVINNTLPSVPLTHRDGQRIITSSTMDVVFGCTATDDDPVQAGWIQYLVISSHLSDLNGTELPPAQQMVNVAIPSPLP